MTIEKNRQLQGILTKAHFEHEKGLNSRAYFKTSNHATAEDLVQQTFLKTWMYLIKGGEIELMKAFLYHILNNLIVDQYRKHKTTSLDILLEKGFEPSAPDNSLSMFNIMDGKVAMHTIQRLPEKYKKIVHMRYVQDLTLEEISHSIGASKNSIAVSVHRGVGKLKSLYAIS